MQMAVEVQGITALVTAAGAFGPKLEAGVQKGLSDGAYRFLSHMQQAYLTSGPLYVRRGVLRGNWQVVSQESPPAAVVGTNTPYAPVHNFGFAGAVHVKEHLRARPRATGKAKAPRSAKGRMRTRAEAKRSRQEARASAAQAFASHRMTRGEKQAESREYRRAAGTQGGVEELTGQLAGKAAETGKIQVRAHGRYMKIRGHHYVERSLRDMRDSIWDLLNNAVRAAIEETFGRA